MQTLQDEEWAKIQRKSKDKLSAMHVSLTFLAYTGAGKMEALSKENAKILQKIVEAR